MNPLAIPADLKDYPQWVVWKEILRKDKLTKPPFNPKNNLFASASDPGTWTDFDTALSTLSGNTDYKGLGFVLSKEDPFCFIDLDEPKTKEDAELHKSIVSSFNSYSEVSPSGKGLHIICKASLPCGQRKGPVEIYPHSRYMTMTGQVFKDREICDCQDKCEKLWKFLGGEPTQVSTTEGKILSHVLETHDDVELCKMAAEAKNGELFKALYQGDLSRHNNDHSAADFALINIIGFYTDSTAQVRRIFLASKLGQREKAFTRIRDYVDPMIATVMREKAQLQIPIKFEAIKKSYQEKTKERQILHPEKKFSADYDLFNNPVASVIKPVKKQNYVPPTHPVLKLPPGLVGDLTKFIYDSSYKPVVEISIMGALGLMSGLTGKAYNTTSGVGLNAYYLLLAETGRGKNAVQEAFNKIESYLEVQMPTFGSCFGPSDYASGEGLFKTIADHPTGCFISNFGEFGPMLKRMGNERTDGIAEGFKKQLLVLYSSCGHRLVLRERAYADSKNNAKRLESPAFSFFAECPPQWLYENMTDGMVMSGLLPRFTVLHYTGLRPPSRRDCALVKPEPKLINDLKALATRCHSLMAQRNVCYVETSCAGQSILDEFEEECDYMINTSDEKIAAEMWNRAHLRAMKLAATIAVGIDPDNPVMDEECVTWARNFIEYGTRDMANRYLTDGHSAVPDEYKQENAFMRVLFRYAHMGFEHWSHVPGSDKNLHQHRVIPQRLLQKKLNRLKVFRNDRLGASGAIRRMTLRLIDDGILAEVGPSDRAKHFNSYRGKCYAIVDQEILKQPSIEDQAKYLNDQF